MDHQGSSQLPTRFGTFLAPYHGIDGNPTLQIRRDLDLVRHLDALGFDEAWIGEHHSAGYETIASPEVFIAAAAEHTRRIRLGTGVNSLPYHHPLVLADRIRQLDHQTMGRVVLGAGPGQLASDAFMMGIDPLRQRAMMADALDAVVRLLRGDTVTARTDWFSPGGHRDGGRIDRLSIGLRAGGAARHWPALPRRRRPDGPRRAQRQLGRVREVLRRARPHRGPGCCIWRATSRDCRARR
ncbi:LLM class flavin-dependent oxidoreductase [Streptomyces sp. NBC_01381]|uniref:LLM class flavin-dependent oxidoreductase n=1 Tax=Streptomyces sp. NBC_01381 TaxID=2903845 RepID=UPI00225C014A|nr:LLM class flavin-dependent oxidoreductase [Streptomyces sp. NBC_01381]MCX4671279.1 LLM class flavin-dependent oxidoreductase [Streptomyces sp. NBC_01381]